MLDPPRLIFQPQMGGWVGGWEPPSVLPPTTSGCDLFCVDCWCWNSFALLSADSQKSSPPSPLVLTWACPNTATPCFRTFGPFLEPSFLRFQTNRECGL